ncbi:MAG: TetR/AcrR family transcriptional regulator C-terminal domain-containing protein [Lachnospiraceae bacterium]|nr:TetR/AcrR family transcriptional regulator C-terminal domain-containing protein [Lachnospiraceae bacterium]
MQTKSEMDLRLAESFKELTLRMPIEKITIKDITDGAGVIRPTFYNHFQDKYELLEYIIRTEILEPMMPLIKSGMINAAITIIFTNLSKEREFYHKASRLEGQNSFQSITKECIKSLLYGYMMEETRGRAETGNPLMKKFLTMENLADYYAHSLTFIVMRWLNEDSDVSPSDMADIYEFLMTHSMKDMIEAMQ